MLKKIMPLLLALALCLLLLCGWSFRKEVHQEVYLDVFDTVSTLRGYERSEGTFKQKSQQVHAALLEYHNLFDIYTEYPGGLKAVNDQAGKAAVPVDPKVMELLLDCREFANLTDGRVNAAMGSVLRLWHEAREAGLNDREHAYLPDPEALREAAEHQSFDTVILDEENMTVFITDPMQSLDVGAIAKGWTAQKVSTLLPEGYMLNMGGNVCTRGSKPDGKKWVIGVQSPENPAEYLCTVGVSGLSVVTSGDYQRTYTVDGKAYHHIIDPDTLMPSEYWRSVTILGEDSGMADCLSTALFLMPLEQGQELAAQCGVEVMWVSPTGEIIQTDGFRDSLT